MINKRIATPLGDVYGSYRGREYIELSFGVPNKPIEVINVFDYEKGCPVIEDTDEAVEQAMAEWLSDLDPYNLAIYFKQ